MPDVHPGGWDSTTSSPEIIRLAVMRGMWLAEGPPGIRRYHPGYCTAFVLDPDGCNIEAVCHQG